MDILNNEIQEIIESLPIISMTKIGTSEKIAGNTIRYGDDFIRSTEFPQIKKIIAIKLSKDVRKRKTLITEDVYILERDKVNFFINNIKKVGSYAFGTCFNCSVREIMKRSSSEVVALKNGDNKNPADMQLAQLNISRYVEELEDSYTRVMKLISKERKKVKKNQINASKLTNIKKTEIFNLLNKLYCDGYTTNRIFTQNNPTKYLSNPKPYEAFIFSLSDILYYTLSSVNNMFERGAYIKKCSNDNCKNYYFSERTDSKYCFYKDKKVQNGFISCVEKNKIFRAYLNPFEKYLYKDMPTYMQLLERLDKNNSKIMQKWASILNDTYPYSVNGFYMRYAYLCKFSLTEEERIKYNIKERLVKIHKKINKNKQVSKK